VAGPVSGRVDQGTRVQKLATVPRSSSILIFFQPRHVSFQVPGEGQHAGGIFFYPPPSRVAESAAVKLDDAGPSTSLGLSAAGDILPGIVNEPLKDTPSPALYVAQLRDSRYFTRLRDVIDYVTHYSQNESEKAAVDLFHTTLGQKKSASPSPATINSGFQSPDDIAEGTGDSAPKPKRPYERRRPKVAVAASELACIMSDTMALAIASLDPPSSSGVAAAKTRQPKSTNTTDVASPQASRRRGTTGESVASKKKLKASPLPRVQSPTSPEHGLQHVLLLSGAKPASGKSRRRLATLPMSAVARGTTNGPIDLSWMKGSREYPVRSSNVGDEFQATVIPVAGSIGTAEAMITDDLPP
jgi:hypothetical protein